MCKIGYIFPKVPDEMLQGYEQSVYKQGRNCLPNGKMSGQFPARKYAFLENQYFTGLVVR